MTLLSLDNACTLENFDNNTKLLDHSTSCKTPVMPLPTEPPSFTNYHWKNDFSVSNSLTNGPFAGSKYYGLEGEGLVNTHLLISEILIKLTNITLIIMTTNC